MPITALYTFSPLSLLSLPGMLAGGGEDDDGWHTGAVLFRTADDAARAAMVGLIHLSCKRLGGPQYILECRADWDADTWEGYNEANPVPAYTEDPEWPEARYLRPGTELGSEPVEPLRVVALKGCRYTDCGTQGPHCGREEEINE